MDIDFRGFGFQEIFQIIHRFKAAGIRFDCQGFGQSNEAEELNNCHDEDQGKNLDAFQYFFFCIFHSSLLKLINFGD